MNSRLARLLTRLYPPAWRARYGAEYRMFLEVRRVSTAEILNVIWHAALEHVLEDWRYCPNLVALLFSVEGALYLAGGHAGNTIAQHPALATTWIAMEAGAVMVMLYALSIAVPLTRVIAPKGFMWILLLVAAAWSLLQYLPGQWTSGWWASPISVCAVIAGAVGIWFAGLCAKIILHKLQHEPDDPEWLSPFLRYWLSKTGKWGPAKFEALRLSVMILSSTIFAAQMRRADHLVSSSIIIGTTVMLFWEDVVHPREAE